MTDENVQQCVELWGSPAGVSPITSQRTIRTNRKLSLNMVGRETDEISVAMQFDSRSLLRHKLGAPG